MSEEFARAVDGADSSFRESAAPSVLSGDGKGNVTGISTPTPDVVGHAYPSIAINVNHVQDDSDVQSPWETSRLEHIWRVALAYASTGDDVHVKWVVAELRSWGTLQPGACGCELDGHDGSRAAGDRHCRDSSGVCWLACLDRWCRAARRHDAVPAHRVRTRSALPDWGARTRTRYLICLACLTALRVHLPSLDALGEENAGVVDALEETVFAQVLDDGVDFENAIGYHLLVAEVLGYSLMCKHSALQSVRSDVVERIVAMRRYAMAMTFADGSLVEFGDDDDDFLLPGACGYFELGSPGAFAGSLRSGSWGVGCAHFRDRTPSRGVSGRWSLHSWRGTAACLVQHDADRGQWDWATQAQRRSFLLHSN